MPVFRRLDGSGGVIQIGDAATMGRDPRNPVCVDDPRVSREHARLTWEADGWLLVDHNSANGTWVDGQRVTRHWLQPGEIVRLGDTQLEFLLNAPTGTAPAALSTASRRRSSNAIALLMAGLVIFALGVLAAAAALTAYWHFKGRPHSPPPTTSGPSAG